MGKNSLVLQLTFEPNSTSFKPARVKAYTLEPRVEKSERPELSELVVIKWRDNLRHNPYIGS